MATVTTNSAKTAAVGTKAASAPVGVTAKPKDAKKEARKAEKKAARAVILSFLNDEAGKKIQLPNGVREALTALFRKSAGGGGQTSMADKVAEAFRALAVGAGLDELALFKQFKIGRGEMRKKVRAIIRDNAPAERLWIAFDDETESWVLKGKGEKAPAGWKGYMPTANEDK